MEYGGRVGCCVGPLPPVPRCVCCVVVLLLSPCSRTILRTAASATCSGLHGCMC